MISKLLLKYIGFYFLMFVSIIAADILADEYIREGNDVFATVLAVIIANYLITRYNKEKNND